MSRLTWHLVNFWVDLYGKFTIYIPDLIWVGDSKDELSSFPKGIKRQLGFALRAVQNGEMPDIAKPLTGYGGSVYELKAKNSDNTYRVVFVINLKNGVYVIDAFVKKSKSGKAVPKEIKERIERRLKYAKKRDEE